jgi:SsrA-binding protein
MAKKANQPDNTIALNRKALHDYFIEEHYEAGIVLEGWEVKSLRAGRAQLKESYVILKNGEAFIVGMHISPLLSASTHVNPDPTRTRKLLLKRKEINNLIGAVERKGYTAIALSMYWSKQRVKLKVVLAHGKKQYDKRQTEKERDWKREKQQAMKHKNR